MMGSQRSKCVVARANGIHSCLFACLLLCACENTRERTSSTFTVDTGTSSPCGEQPACTRFGDPGCCAEENGCSVCFGDSLVGAVCGPSGWECPPGRMFITDCITFVGGFDASVPACDAGPFGRDAQPPPPPDTGIDSGPEDSGAFPIDGG
jgi:hypothetical protein